MFSFTLLIPAFLEVAKALLGGVASDVTVSMFSQIIDLITKQSHEQQMKDCIKKAFKRTKKQQHWKVNTRKALKTFQSSLISFSGSFSQNSLSKVLSNAIGKEVDKSEVEQCIDNLLRQLSLDEHKELREYLLLRRILIDSREQTECNEKFILTPYAPIRDNPEIICRDAFIDDLLQLLSSGHKRIQITGMGGLGKTETLAKLFAKLADNKQLADFEHIAYIRFSGEILTDVESQIYYPREYLGFQGIEAARHYLHDICAEKNVLLCIDDIRANQEIIRQDHPSIQFFRTLGAFIVLAARAGFPDFKRNDLDFLPSKACIELFEKKFGRAVTDITDVEILTNIIENRAGKHTLIINRLGTMAKDYGWSIPVLAERLKDKNFDFQKGIADEDLLQQEINKLYQVNEELIVAEKSILEAFSIFPAIPLSADICIGWLHEDAGVDKDTCFLLLNKLAEKTWLEKRFDSENSASFVMHPLVQAAVQEQTDPNAHNHNQLISQCIASIDQNTTSFNFIEASKHILFATSLFSINPFDSIAFAKLAASIGLYYYETADFQAALEWHLQAKDICEKLLGSNALDTAYIYSNIAQIYGKMGEYHIALEWFEKDLAICEAALGVNHNSTATTYNNIAEVLNSLGNYDLSLDWFMKSLAVKERTLENGHLDFAAAYNNIAVVCENKGEYEVALTWFSKALPIVIKQLGAIHPKVAATYNNIAAAYYRLGNIEKAFELFMKALKIREKVLGKDHPDTATSYSNIGIVLASKKEYHEALQWHIQAIAISEKVLGKRHPDTATFYNNIVLVYEKLLDYETALDWCRKALAIREEVLGLEHPDTATTYNNIAGILFTQGLHSESLSWFEKALHIREKVLSQDHPDTAVTYLNIAGVNYHLREYVKALSYCEKALTIFESKLGSEHTNTKNAMASKSEILKQLQLVSET